MKIESPKRSIEKDVNGRLLLREKCVRRITPNDVSSKLGSREAIEIRDLLLRTGL